MFFKKILIGAAILSASAAQAATPVYSDNFDNDTLALNATTFLGGWAVSGGTVDIIGAGGDFNLAPGNGRYIDLDGSTNNAGIFANAVNVVAGRTHTLSFTAATGGTAGFSFIDNGSDNQGALLDNVSITAVPEPETYGMMLGGLALLGVVARRRRQG